MHEHVINIPDDSLAEVLLDAVRFLLEDDEEVQEDGSRLLEVLEKLTGVDESFDGRTDVVVAKERTGEPEVTVGVLLASSNHPLTHEAEALAKAHGFSLEISPSICINWTLGSPEYLRKVASHSTTLFGENDLWSDAVVDKLYIKLKPLVLVVQTLDMVPNQNVKAGLRLVRSEPAE